ncbi:MAG: hypothetical protein WC244_02385 [Patescibacteria group bacterium]|jgi:hypothetical protein
MAASSIWKLDGAKFGYEIHDFSGIGDYGTIYNLSDSDAEQKVCFERAKRGLGAYTSAPIVIVNPLSSAGPNPAQPYVYSINSSCFKIKSQAWNGQERHSKKESVSFLVIPEGGYTKEGLNIKAGFVGTVTSTWQGITGLNPAQDKVVFTQAQDNLQGGLLQVERIRKIQPIPATPVKTEITNANPTLKSNGQEDLNSNFCVDGDNGKAPFDSAAIMVTRSIIGSDSCQGNILKEKFCVKDSSGKYSIGTEDVLCPGGCQYGACVNNSPYVWQVSTQREKQRVKYSAPKRIGYISFAWAGGDSSFNGVVGGSQIEIGNLTAGNIWRTKGFISIFDSSPSLLADMNSANEADSAGLRSILSSNSFSIKVEEETANATHRSENIVYLAIGKPEKIPTCTDSDFNSSTGESDPFIKGTVNGMRIDGQVVSMTDFCTKDNIWPSSSSTPTGPFVAEWYCKDGLVNQVLVGCDNSCMDGACLKAADDSPIVDLLPTTAQLTSGKINIAEIQIINKGHDILIHKIPLSLTYSNGVKLSSASNSIIIKKNNKTKISSINSPLSLSTGSNGESLASGTAFLANNLLVKKNETISLSVYVDVASIAPGTTEFLKVSMCPEGKFEWSDKTTGKYNLTDSAINNFTSCMPVGLFK